MGLWVPKSARPKWRCNLCGAEFHEDEQRRREAHTKRCADEHAAQLHAEHPVNKLPGFMRAFDPEYEAWVQKHKRIA